jgi:hypothetical protein
MCKGRIDGHGSSTIQFIIDSTIGMNGKNTDTLTYRGKVSNSKKRRVRAMAGCKRGFCRQFGTDELNSCDEVCV